MLLSHRAPDLHRDLGARLRLWNQYLRNESWFVTKEGDGSVVDLGIEKRIKFTLTTMQLTRMNKI